MKSGALCLTCPSYEKAGAKESVLSGYSLVFLFLPECLSGCLLVYLSVFV